MFKKYYSKWIKCCCLLCSILLIISPFSSYANANHNGMTFTAGGVVLMESSTGTILYKKNCHKKLRPASVTKIMTLLLIFEALDEGKIQLEDLVTTSQHAASMGGSNVYLEENEQQTVETMIKCICIASANDAAVAMAEHLAGTEDAFVEQMNQRAKELEMNDTHFVNACGLDEDHHVTSALDIAIMSRELIEHHPKVLDYTGIWMDSFQHVTKRGTSKFDLSNTNKLLKQYPYATGLKTGSTSLAKYSVSATATKDGLTLIAVILSAPNPKDRFSEAKTLLNYGFSNCKVFEDQTPTSLPKLMVDKGQDSKVHLKTNHPFRYIETKGRDFSKIKKIIELPKSVPAPLNKKIPVGNVVYYLGEEKIGSIPIYAAKDVPIRTFMNCMTTLLFYFLPI